MGRDCTTIYSRLLIRVSVPSRVHAGAALALLLLGGCGSLPQVSAVAETTPVSSREDAADDPAIWIDREDPERSLILGTDKQRGLHVYGLDGEERQFLGVGLLNNVDLRQDLPAGDTRIDLAVASNRSDQSLALFRVTDDEQPLEHLPEASIATGFTEVYGVCLYRSRVSGDVYAFANDKDGRYAQWRLDFDAGRVTGSELVREFRLGSQPEGCVADDVTGLLYMGEEARGIWRIGAEPDAAPPPVLIDSTRSAALVADVEGLALYRDSSRTLLIASSQGNNSFAVYDVSGATEYLGSFRIGAAEGGSPDAASDTDGIEATPLIRSEQYPAGILVVQDGRNGARNQNFKYVSMADVLAVIEPVVE